MKSDVQMKIDQLNKQLNIGSTEFGELLIHFSEKFIKLGLMIFQINFF